MGFSVKRHDIERPDFERLPAGGGQGARQGGNFYGNANAGARRQTR